MVVVRKLAVCFDAIIAASNDRDILRVELCTQALKGPPLCSSPTRARPGIEPEDNLLAGVILERDVRTSVRDDLKVRRDIARL